VYVPGPRSTSARVRPVLMVRVPPTSRDPGVKQHLSPVWMRTLCPRSLSFTSSKTIGPAFAVRRFLSKSTTPGAVSTDSVKNCFSGPELPHAASTAAHNASVPAITLGT
jgi:hypothetical protein